MLVVEADSGSVLGIVERERAYSTVHDGAIYLHLGDSYLVSELDLAAGTALVEPFSGDWYTQAKKDTTTAIEEAVLVRDHAGVELSFGRVSVTEHVVAYQRKSTRDGAVLETVALDLPPATFETEAVWFVPSPPVLDGLEAMPKLLGSLHAAEHAMIALLPLFAMCDRWDIGGLSTNVHFQTGRPTVFVYDGHPGGVGIAERGYDGVRRVGGRTRRACSPAVHVRAGARRACSRTLARRGSAGRPRAGTGRASAACRTDRLRARPLATACPP